MYRKNELNSKQFHPYKCVFTLLMQDFQRSTYCSTPYCNKDMEEILPFFETFVIFFLPPTKPFLLLTRIMENTQWINSTNLIFHLTLCTAQKRLILLAKELIDVTLISFWLWNVKSITYFITRSKRAIALTLYALLDLCFKTPCC